MKKGYWIVRVDVTDPPKYEAYLNAVFQALAPYGGHYLVRGGSFEVEEGSAKPRNVVVAFPSYKAALDCYHSPGYQRVKALRRGGADFDLIVVEGYDGPQPG